MTTATLLPNGDIVVADARTPYTTDWECVEEGGSNSSYVTITNMSTEPVYALSSFTLDNAVVKSCEVLLRAAHNGNPVGIDVLLERQLKDTEWGDLTSALGAVSANTRQIDTGFQDFTRTITAPTKYIPVTQTHLDGLRLRCRRQSSSGGSVFISYLTATITYVPQPVAVVTAVTDPWIVSSSPDISWVHSVLDADGGPQKYYDVRVFDETTYGVGFSGLDPETDTPYWFSGEKPGSDQTIRVGALEDGDTYRAYVKIAQVVNGVQHWSDWVYDEFDVNTAAPPVVTIATTANNTNGYVNVQVTRSSGTWDLMEIQRSVDGGSTWTDVRWAALVDATGDPDDFETNDREVPNGVSCLHRARATQISAGYYITGSWVQSTPAVTWTSTSTFMKAPVFSTYLRDITVQFRQSVAFTLPARRGVFNVLGSQYPVVVSDTRGGAASNISIAVESLADADTVIELINDFDVLLVQTPTDQPWGSRYVSVGSAQVVPALGDRVHPEITIELLECVEVDAPPDPSAGR